MKDLHVILISVITIFLSFTANAEDEHQIIWTAVFSKGVPINNTIMQMYCDQHTPTVVVSTIDQLTSKTGVKSLNNLTIHMVSHKATQKDNLHFNIVDVTINGLDKAGKKWSLPMRLYEQTLNPDDVTDAVWSTPYCKGKFVGVPTIIKK